MPRRGGHGADDACFLCCVRQAHFKSGWVLSQVGRAHYEMVRYSDALRAFKKAHDVEPHRLAGMELHSTILWHLKREVGRSPGRAALVQHPQSRCCAQAAQRPRSPVGDKEVRAPA